MGRFLVTSDWHLDAYTAGVSRFEDVANAACETIEVAQKEDCDGFVFMGDLCDPPARSHRAIEYTAQLIHMLGKRPSIWLGGNHDVIEDGHGTTTLSGLKQLTPRANVIDRPQFGIWPPLDCYVICLPFTPRSHDYDPAAFIEESAADYKEHGNERDVLVFAHLNVEGVQPGSETNDMPRGRNVFLPLDALWKHFPGALIFNGHYHESQVFEKKRGRKKQKVHIPGSLERLKFGEEHNTPGYFIVETP